MGHTSAQRPKGTSSKDRIPGSGSRAQETELYEYYAQDYWGDEEELARGGPRPPAVDLLPKGLIVEKALEVAAERRPLRLMEHEEGELRSEGAGRGGGTGTRHDNSRCSKPETTSQATTYDAMGDADHCPRILRR